MVPVGAGLAFSVYHPADYAIISSAVDESRLGRAFSLHAVTGNLGSAAAPLVMVALVTFFGVRRAAPLGAAENSGSG